MMGNMDETSINSETVMRIVLDAVSEMGGRVTKLEDECRKLKNQNTRLHAYTVTRLAGIHPQVCDFEPTAEALRREQEELRKFTKSLIREKKIQ